MNKLFDHKLFGLAIYVLAMLALHQVIIIPLLAFVLILAIYKAPSDLFRAHAKYMLTVFAGVTLVVLIVANGFAPEERVLAGLTAVGIGFLMLLLGAYRIVYHKMPVWTKAAA